MFVFLFCAVQMLWAQGSLPTVRSEVQIDSNPSGITVECHEYLSTPGGFMENYYTMVTPFTLYPMFFFDEFGFYECYYQLTPNEPGWTFTPETINIYDGSQNVFFSGTSIDPPPPQFSTVYISSEPTGAEVMVNGYPQGVTPCELAIAEGEFYEISLFLEGWVFDPLSTPVMYEPYNQNVHFTGSPKISINSDPSGADVTVNGEWFGSTPLELVLSQGITYDVAVFLPGWNFSPPNQMVTYENPQNLFFMGVPIESWVFVTSEPSGAEVWINESFLYGTTPCQIMIGITDFVNVSVSLDGWSFDPLSYSVSYSESSQSIHFVGNPILNIDSAPPGADVMINGTYVGFTPYQTTISPSDVFDVSVSLPGYVFFPQSQIVTYNDAPISLFFGGEMMASQVYVSSDPSGAEVFINDGYYGTTPCLVEMQILTSMNVFVSMQGWLFEPPSQTVYPQLGPQSVHFSGTPIYPEISIVSIISEPQGANVIINGVFSGVTPMEYIMTDGFPIFVSLELAGWIFDPAEQTAFYLNYPQTLYFYGTSIGQPESTQGWIWAKQAGGSNYDIGRSIAVDNAGNNYVTGSFWNESASFGNITLPNSGGHDIFIAKIDANGNWLWAKKAGGSSFDISNGITVDNNGNCYVTGHFSATASFGSYTLNSSGGQDVFVAKLDTNGNWLWAKRAGGTQNETASGIAIDNLGNCLIAGEFYGTAAFGSTNLTSNNNLAVFVAKLNQSGNWIWAKQTGGYGGRAQSIAADNSGNCVVCGLFYENTSFGNTTLTSSNGNADVFVAKLNASGNWLWAKRAGSTSYDEATSIELDNDGNSYVSGNYNVGGIAGEMGGFGTYQIFSSGDSEIFVAKLSQTGAWLWAKSAGSANWDYSLGLDASSSGNCYITGCFYAEPGSGASFGTNTLMGSGNSEIFVAKLDTSGNWLWAKRAFGNSDEISRDIAVDGSGNSYIIGSFGDYYTGGSVSFGSYALSNNHSTDIFVARLCGDNDSYLTCTVKDSGGQAIPNVDIVLIGANLQYNTLTDAYGQFSVGNLSVNQLNILAHKTGYESVSQSIMIGAGANHHTLIMAVEGIQADSLALSTSLTIYADSIEQTSNLYYSISGNVSINGVLSIPGQVYVDKRAYLVHPRLYFYDDLLGINVNGTNPVIFNNVGLPIVYSVIGNELVPADFDCIVESFEHVFGYEFEIGRLTIGESQVLGKYVEVMAMFKTAENNFFSKLIDWLGDDQHPSPPEFYMANWEKIAVSIYYAENTGISYGCDISGISCNFGAFSVEDFSLNLNIAESVFGGSLKLKIPGVGYLDGYERTGLVSFDTPVVITDSDSGKEYLTNLGNLADMNRQGIFHHLIIEAELEFAQGRLNNLAISLSGMNIPLFYTGTFIREIHGGVYDLAVNDLRVEASVDIGLHSSLDIPLMGPVVYLNDVGVVIKPWKYLQGGGEFQFFKQTVADGKFYYDDGRNCLGLEANVMLMMEANNPGSTIVKGQLYGNLNTSNLNAGMNAQIKTPDDLPWYLAWAEGLALASADVSIHNFELSMMIQIYHLSLANKLVYGKPIFPFFHYYVGDNYENMIQLWKGNRDGRSTIDFQVPENAQQILIVAGNGSNLFDFSVTEPGGTIYNNNNSGYHQFPSSSQTILVIDNPKSGNWMFSTGQQGAITTEFKVINQAPSALVSMPATRGSRDNKIRLSMMDYSDTLKVEVYYDTDNQHFDGVFIQEFSVMNNADLEFLWHNSDLQNGEYYIYTRINDGKNSPVLQYAPGSIIVNNYYVEAPQNVTATVSNGSLHVAWNAPMGSDILLTEISVQDVYNKSQYSYSVVNENNYSISDLPVGREYSVRCRFANLESKMSDYSSAVNLVVTGGSRVTPPYFAMDKDVVWTFVENQTNSFEINVVNPDGAGISIFLLDNEYGMSLVDNTFFWTPSMSQKGYYRQAIVVTSGAGSDTLYQQIAVYSEEQTALKVRFSSYNLYEADQMFVKVNNIYSEATTLCVTLTNLRTNSQISVNCRRVNRFEFIGQFMLSVINRTEMSVIDGDQIQATYIYNGNTYTAISIYSSQAQAADLVSPTAVNDLQATLMEGGTIKMQWTATGDNENEGRAFKYDLRYSYQPIQTADDFMSANLYPISIYPSESGTIDTLTIAIQDLGNISHYNNVYFSLVVEDSHLNRSGLSNNVSLAYLASPAWVNAVMVNDAWINVNWTEMYPGRYVNQDNSRRIQARDEVSVIGYQLWRDHNGSLSLMADSLSTPNYSHNITSLADGSLRYGVKTIYDSGASGLCFSNILNLQRFNNIRILCQQDGIQPASAVQYNIVGLDSLYQQSFSGITNPSGMILLDNVYRGNYQVSLSRSGCFPLTQMIELSGTDFEMVLDIYSVLPPEDVNLEIADNQLHLWWNPVPGAAYYKIYLSDNPLTLDWGEPVVVQTETSATLPLVGENMFYRVVAGKRD